MIWGIWWWTFWSFSFPSRFFRKGLHLPPLHSRNTPPIKKNKLVSSGGHGVNFSVFDGLPNTPGSPPHQPCCPCPRGEGTFPRPPLELVVVVRFEGGASKETYSWLPLVGESMYLFVIDLLFLLHALGSNQLLWQAQGSLASCPPKRSRVLAKKAESSRCLCDLKAPGTEWRSWRRLSQRIWPTSCPGSEPEIPAIARFPKEAFISLERKGGD